MCTGPPRAAVKSVCSEYKIHNADVHMRDDCDIDDLVDVIEGSRVYIPCIYVINKIDQITLEELNIIGRCRPWRSQAAGGLAAAMLHAACCCGARHACAAVAMPTAPAGRGCDALRTRIPYLRVQEGLQREPPAAGSCRSRASARAAPAVWPD